MRARATLILLSFLAALAGPGIPPAAAAGTAALGRASVTGGAIDPTPAVVSHQAPSLALAARATGARPGHWKLPLLAVAPALEAPPFAALSGRAPEAAAAPIAPPSAPRSCRGPPRA